MKKSYYWRMKQSHMLYVNAKVFQNIQLELNIVKVEVLKIFNSWNVLIGTNQLQNYMQTIICHLFFLKSHY